MRYAYYPGCSLHTTGIEYGLSTEAAAKTLGVELLEIPEWNCCGASAAHATNHWLALALPARNLALAEKQGLDVAVPCAACFNRMKGTEAAARESDEARQNISRIIEMDYGATNTALSLLDVFTNKVGLENISPHVKKPLKGLKVACYYGCLMVKPPHLTHFDDPENPMTMDNLMASLGAVPVAWPYKTECCGSGFAASRTDLVLKMSYDVLRIAKECGAEAIATACPLCMVNLDMRQKEIEHHYRASLGLPVFYFTELMALAFGYSPERVGLTKHFVDAKPLVRDLEQRPGTEEVGA